jgi:hypothetical protein
MSKALPITLIRFANTWETKLPSRKRSKRKRLGLRNCARKRLQALYSFKPGCTQPVCGMTINLFSVEEKQLK